jgi:hypothetical protein
MDWDAETLYGKAKAYVRRAHDAPIESPLFGFWMSLSLELLARSALAKLHPVLLADPTSEENIHYAFGVIPKKPHRSVAAKAVFARCSILVPGFTDKMSGHCLILAERRNSELHSGAAAFVGIDNSAWLPATYEVMDVLLKHIGREFYDFLGRDHANHALVVLSDRRENVKKDVLDRVAAARKLFASLSEEAKAQLTSHLPTRVERWVSESTLRRTCMCPACSSVAIMGGESVGRTPVQVDEEAVTLRREVRVLPNGFVCPYCKLQLSGFQEMNEAGLGSIYTVEEEEDPIKFFGIVPEEHVDIDELLKSHFAEEYQNE